MVTYFSSNFSRFASDFKRVLGAFSCICYEELFCHLCFQELRLLRAPLLCVLYVQTLTDERDEYLLQRDSKHNPRSHKGYEVHTQDKKEYSYRKDKKA